MKEVYIDYLLGGFRGEMETGSDCDKERKALESNIFLELLNSNSSINDENKEEIIESIKQKNMIGHMDQTKRG